MCTSRIFWRPARSGGCTATRRSNRPGRSSAWSSTSGRLVAPITITPVDESKPSISVRIWFSVCSRSSLPPLKPATPDVRERPIASSSSMNTIAGDDSFACANRSRTRAAPTPTIASTNSDADMEKNGAFASPATARASSVLPVPGGPDSRTPCGMWPPSRTYLSGLRRKSTTSDSSAFASSMPATSAKVTLPAAGSYRRARERPNEPSAFCTPEARRMSRNSSPTKRIVGPKPTSTLSHHGAPVSSGTALTTTPFCSSSFDSATVSANAGISVWNRVDDFEPW